MEATEEDPANLLQPFDQAPAQVQANPNANITVRPAQAHVNFTGADRTGVLLEIPPPVLTSVTVADSSRNRTHSIVGAEQRANKPSPSNSSTGCDSIPGDLPFPINQIPRINCTDDFLGQQGERVDEDPTRLLFWSVIHVQNQTLWALADTGSCRNLMSEQFWNTLNLKTSLSPPGLRKVLAGDGLPLEIVGWITLIFRIGCNTVCHEVGVVKGLPVDFLIGGEFMYPHRCMLGYGDSQQH